MLKDHSDQYQKRFHSIVNMSVDAILVVNQEGIILFANNASEKLFNLPISQLVGSPFGFPLVVGESTEIDFPPPAHSTRDVLTGEMRITQTDWDGVQAYLAVIHDITYRKQIERQLWESQERFTQFSDHLDDILWLSTPDKARFLYVSSAFTKLFGRKVQDLYSDPLAFMDMVLPDDRQIVLEGIENQKKGISGSMEYRIRRDDGSTRWIRSRYFPIHDESGKLFRTAGIVQDITDEKLAHDALRRSEQRYRRLVESMGEGLAVINDDLIITYVNDSFCRIWGYKREDILNRPLTDFLHPDHRLLMQEQWNNRRRGERGSYEVSWKGYGGKRIWTLVSATPMFEKEDRFVGSLIVVSDITQHKQAEDERQHLEEQILETQKLESLGILAGGIAHDFNNILMGILGNASLVLSEIDSDSPAYEYANEIGKAAQRAADLTNQLLAYAGKGRFVIQLVNLPLLIHEMQPLIHSTISKNIKLSLQLDDNTPLIEADATQVRQVLMNLIMNASEAIGNKPGTIEIRTSLAKNDEFFREQMKSQPALSLGPCILLEVQDDGCGMTEEVRSKIFDPFFTTKFLGRGLGLSAVMGIIRSHQGTIQVQSTPGKGTCFKILIPSQIPKKSNALPSPLENRTTILLAEDDETIRKVVRSMLERKHYHVISARDGAEALELFNQNPDQIDLILLDLTMPRLNGEQLLRHVREVKPSQKVILTSGYPEDSLAQDFEGYHLSGFIQKPYVPSILYEKLEKALNP